VTPDQYCQDKAAPGGSLPYYSFLFLPPERRHAITALHAFRREVEAIIDESHDAGVAHQRLDWWRGELRRLYDGQPSHPVTQALQPHIAPCGLPQSEFSDVLDGLEMDLTQTRYLDEAGLKRYCQCAGGAVGVLSARALGFSDPRTLDFARQLGLSGEQAEVARTLYREALALLPRQDRRAQRAALVMAALSHAQLDEIEASQFQVLTQRIALTPMRMLWIAWKTWLRNR